jgi:L-amino acid N-acyltransferase YncA
MQDDSVRRARLTDAHGIARVYNQGIEDRVATFETRLRTDAEIEQWLHGRHPIVVCTRGDAVTAFASTSAYRDRACYAGIAEFSVYVARDARSQGLGRMALDNLIAEAREAGFWKLLSRIFPENEASRRLVASAGFREVGFYQKHGQLDGVWKDVVIVERLLRP